MISWDLLIGNVPRWCVGIPTLEQFSRQYPDVCQNPTFVTSLFLETLQTLEIAICNVDKDQLSENFAGKLHTQGL